MHLSIPEFLRDAIKNVHLNLSVEGWPAAFSVAVVAISFVAVAAINAGHSAQ